MREEGAATVDVGAARGRMREEWLGGMQVRAWIIEEVIPNESKATNQASRASFGIC